MISIIIPVYNNLDTTSDCLTAVMQNTSGEYNHDFEIVVIDNGSNPPFPSGSMSDPIIIRNESNLGFPVAINQGIAAAKGDIIIILNNDVIVTYEWDKRLLAHLNKYSIIGPVTNYCAGMQQVTIPTYNDDNELNIQADKWYADNKDNSQEVNWVIGFCMAFRKSLCEEIGPFDESLWPCSGEELIFCLRARKLGYHIGIAKDVYMHHYGSQTFNELERVGEINYLNICKRNEQYVAKQFGANFWNEQRYIPEPIKGIRLNLGCGKFHMDGFINIDQFEDVNPDLVCDITNLPYKLSSVSEIYAGHVLEHFKFAEGMDVLRYWHSLLVPGGVINIVVPDYDFLVKQYAANPSPEALIIFNDVYTFSNTQPSPHQYAYSAALLEKVMREVGFQNITRMLVDHHYFPFSVEWQAGFQGTK